MASKYGGYMGKVLRIDLTSRKVSLYPWSDEERRLYLGGKIMAAKILYDTIPAGTDPLSPANNLVVTTGPLTGTGAPSSSRFNISTLSPLTGFIASSNCGGSFGTHLKKAGYDGLVISGKADLPTWIEIVDDEVIFHDATHLWGKTTGETQEELGGRTGKLVIGPAGENGVLYAAIFSGERTAGRAGVGAVMGSKNLKAVVASGTRTVPVHAKEKVKALNKKWVELLQKNPLTGNQLPKLGTAGLLRIMQDHKILATRNYQYGQYNQFADISGETLAERYLLKNKGCLSCPIQCGRVVEVNGKEVKGPELETLGLLGSNLENNNLELILQWNFLLDELGMDTISAGSTIAFAMELNERGLWKNGLEFGKVEGLADIFQDIAHRRGVGDLLADGSKRLSAKFGGTEYAIHSKGLELAAYEPRGAVGQGLGYAVANRGGCHLNAGYLVVLEGLGLSINPHTPKAKAELTVLFQNLMEGISASGSCIFTSYTMLPGFIVGKPDSWLTRMVNTILVHSGGVVNLLNHLPAAFLPIQLPTLPHTRALGLVIGESFSFGRLKEIGERGYNLERMFNLKHGLTEKDDTLPARLTEIPQDSSDSATRVPLSTLKGRYYQSRGWNGRGEPTRKTLRRLSLEEDRSE